MALVMAVLLPSCPGLNRFDWICPTGAQEQEQEEEQEQEQEQEQEPEQEPEQEQEQELERPLKQKQEPG